MSYCNHANQKEFPFTLPVLPYAKYMFTPYFSKETFDYHYDKHHQTYVNNLNNLIEHNTAMHGIDLEKIIKTSYIVNDKIFNNASQIWNHTFFWYSIKPNAGGVPTGYILNKINEDFGSYMEFAHQFHQTATTHFGSGWLWLLLNQQNQLKIASTTNAETPITSEKMYPIIVCDLWEHAYYIDFRNKRNDYISSFLDHMINWDFALTNIKQAMFHTQ